MLLDVHALTPHTGTHTHTHTCRHPDPESRPLVCAIVTQLQRPDFLLLQWSEGETSQYSEEARTLGTALENGHCLHVELQRRYLKEGGPTVERSEQ